MGKAPLSFRRLCLRRRSKKKLEPPPSPAPPSMGASSAPTAAQNAIAGAVSAATGKGKKKAGGARLWMRFDFTGKSELVECDKSVIIERAGVPARDLRILGPVFSHSSNILGDFIVNLCSFDLDIFSIVISSFFFLCFLVLCIFNMIHIMSNYICYGKKKKLRFFFCWG